MYLVYSYNTLESYHGTVVEERVITPFSRLLDARFFLDEELEKFGNARKIVWKRKDIPKFIKKKVTVFDGFDERTFLIAKLNWGEGMEV